jgi:hypothetical protein
MLRAGWDVQLTEYGDGHWRATFYVTGQAHSIVGGTAWGDATAGGAGRGVGGAREGRSAVNNAEDVRKQRAARKAERAARKLRDMERVPTPKLLQAMDRFVHGKKKRIKRARVRPEMTRRLRTGRHVTETSPPQSRLRRAHEAIALLYGSAAVEAAFRRRE